MQLWILLKYPKMEKMIDSLEKISDDVSKKFTEDDELCHGQISNVLSDNLYDLFCEISPAKKIWESLDKKYGKEDVGNEKYFVGECFEFEMVDGKSLIDQAHEVQNLVAKIKVKGIPLDERLQVPALIDNFPPSWNDYQITFKHWRETLSIDELTVSIQIEEKRRDKKTKISY